MAHAGKNIDLGFSISYQPGLLFSFNKLAPTTPVTCQANNIFLLQQISNKHQPMEHNMQAFERNNVKLWTAGT